MTPPPALSISQPSQHLTHTVGSATSVTHSNINRRERPPPSGRHSVTPAGSPPGNSTRTRRQPSLHPALGRGDTDQTMVLSIVPNLTESLNDHFSSRFSKTLFQYHDNNYFNYLY